MEMYQLRTFAAVARTSSVTRAATELNTTPPSVSTHIRQLEEELDVPLFTRTPKGMAITSQGKQLLEQALKILDQARDMAHLAKTMQKDITGRVSLGINADPGFLRTDLIIERIYHSYPGIRLEIVPSSTQDIIDGVKKGTMTCGYAFGPVRENGIIAIDLCHVDLVIAIPARFSPEFQTAGLKKLADLPWIVPEKKCPFFRLVASRLEKKGINITQKVFANDDITKMVLINKGAAVCVLEKNEAHPLIDSSVARPWLGPEDFASSLSFVFAASQKQDRVIKAMTAVMEVVWRQSRPS